MKMVNFEDGKERRRENLVVKIFHASLDSNNTREKTNTQEFFEGDHLF